MYKTKFVSVCQRSQPFLPVHMGPRSNLLNKNKNGQKSRDTVPLKRWGGGVQGENAVFVQDLLECATKKLVKRERIQQSSTEFWSARFVR